MHTPDPYGKGRDENTQLNDRGQNFDVCFCKASVEANRKGNHQNKD
jgi:hypothetical protein